MKQYEAVTKVMEENGGYSTVGLLYQEVLNIPGAKWKTKTPFASQIMRGEVIYWCRMNFYYLLTFDYFAA